MTTRNVLVGEVSGLPVYTNKAGQQAGSFLVGPTPWPQSFLVMLLERALSHPYLECTLSFPERCGWIINLTEEVINQDLGIISDEENVIFSGWGHYALPHGHIDIFARFNLQNGKINIELELHVCEEDANGNA